MESTSISLLRRLAKPNEEEAWARFNRLYTPLIYHWGRGQGLNVADASDLVQEVMLIVFANLPAFEYDARKSFRGWLRTIATNKARDFLRRQNVRPATGAQDDVARLAASEGVDLFEEAEYRAYVAGRALRLMQAEFRPGTWQACWKHLVEGRPAEEVARELGISVNAVYVAKSRVLRRLREELKGLLD